MLTHFSLFTGIGGIDLAAEWAGFETVGQCEFADYPTKVLEKHWPDVPRWRDVRDVTVESIRERGIEEITLLSGGFPCQPHSLAGKRQASADERDLSGEFIRIVCETNPKWVLGENVPGLLSSEDGRFYGNFLRDLAQVGYSIGWCCFPAYAVGADFKGERVFIVAASDSVRRDCVAQNKQIGLSDLNIEMHQERFNDKENIPTDIYGLLTNPVCGVLRNDDGVPEALDRLKCLGNAVVPQQVYPILKAIAERERGG